MPSSDPLAALTRVNGLSIKGAHVGEAPLAREAPQHQPAAAELLTIPTPTPSYYAPGESLMGLRPPALIDPTQTAVGLISTDETHIAIDGSRSGTSAATANGVATGLAGGRTPARVATTKLDIAAPHAKSNAAQIDLGLRSEAVGKLAASLTQRLRETPAIFSPTDGSGRSEVQDRRATEAATSTLGVLPGAASLQPERAGVIASFILNAAMIPGWPQPILQPTQTDSVQATYIAFQNMDEAQLLEYVAALGGDEVLLTRVIKSCDDSDGRRKMLRAAIILATVVGAFVTALRTEIEDLLVDFGLIESGETPAAWGGRLRLPL